MRLHRIAIAALAVAATLVPSAGSAAPSVQQESDSVAQWITRALHRPMPVRTYEADAGVRQRGNAGEYWQNGIVRLAPDVAAGLIGRDEYDRAAALHVVAHETLHTEACWSRVEEGRVEAVTLDLLPALTLRFTGFSIVDGVGYPAEVAAVRKGSALATGQPWRSRAARLWRRALLEVPCAAADDMLASAYTMTKEAR